MAGIGFVLRKLVRRDTLSGIMQGYFHGALASSGPWILTILAIASIYMITRHMVATEAMAQFRTVILYNFCFALVLSSPVTVLATRRLSDYIYAKDLREAPGMLIGTMGLLMACLFPAAMLLYFGIADLPTAVAVQAVINFLLIAAVWMTMVFVSALKFYLAITYSFIGSFAISVVSTALLAISFGAAGMVFGFNLGMAILLASILALIFVEYPRECQGMFSVVGYFKRYWPFALSAFLYNAGAWVDKWVMWFAPGAENFGTGLPNFPIYDSTMFLAYLTIIPVMSMFVISQETAFFDIYLKFYRAIQSDENFHKIQRNHELLVKTLVNSGRNLLLLQLFVAGLTLFAAPKIFSGLGLNFVGLGIFRIGVVGVAFQVLTLFITIFLSYFDERWRSLAINAVFFGTNLIFSLGSRALGLPFYGYGYFLSTLVTFVLAAILIERYVRFLPYHAFIDNNSAVTR